MIAIRRAVPMRRRYQVPSLYPPVMSDVLVQAIRAARRGDFTVRLEGEGELAAEWDAFMAESADAIRDLTLHARAVANGDVSRRFTAPVRGEMAELKRIVNTMTDMLAGF